MATGFRMPKTHRKKAFWGSFARFARLGEDPFSKTPGQNRSLSVLSAQGIFSAFFRRVFGSARTGERTRSQRTDASDTLFAYTPTFPTPCPPGARSPLQIHCAHGDKKGACGQAAGHPSRLVPHAPVAFAFACRKGVRPCAPEAAARIASSMRPSHARLPRIPPRTPFRIGRFGRPAASARSSCVRRGCCWSQASCRPFPCRIRPAGR